MESYRPPRLDREDAICPYCRAQGSLTNFPLYQRSPENVTPFPLNRMAAPRHPYLPLTQRLPDGRTTVFSASRCVECSRLLLWGNETLLFPPFSVRPLALGALRTMYASEVAQIEHAQLIMDLAPAAAAVMLRHVLLALCAPLGYSPQSNASYVVFLDGKLRGEIGKHSCETQRTLLKRGCVRNDVPLEPDTYDAHDDAQTVIALLKLIEYIAQTYFSGA